MDIPLHPATIAALANGNDFLDRVNTLLKSFATHTVTIPFPDDGEGSLTFDGTGMIIAADTPDDLFDRFKGQLSDVLTAMCQEGFAQVQQHADAATAAALGGPAQ